MRLKWTWVVAALVAGTLRADADTALTRGWRFSRVETPDGEFLKGGFDDSTWSEVEVPHDWAIAGPFDPQGDGATGRLPWKGVGVYRRTFTISEQDLQGCVLLDFDGVMARPRVYVNGRLAGGWDYGYMSFRVDATKFARAGTNQLTVVADTRAHRSRWYPGAGICRKVVLKTRPKMHFAFNGIVVTTPVVERDRAVVKVAWETENANEASVVEVKVGTEDKKVRASVGSVDLELKEPMLWDVTNPVLYWAECTLDGGAKESLRFGIRKIAFPVSKDRNAREGNGFYLNGRRVELKGVNLHEDCGILGRAYNRSARLRQLKQMLDMGANALRTSHYPVAPETLDLCDELGILVWDECFDKWDDTASRLESEPLEPYVARNLRAFVRRDRNHPSVIVWSMGNEIGGRAEKKEGFTSDPSGLSRERCRFFRDEMRKEDVTRPIGNGNMPHMAKPKFFERHIWDDLDITGWNYLGSHEKAKDVYPDKPVVYTETGSPGSTYGFYAEPSRTPFSWKEDPELAAKQMDGYDLGTTIDIADWEFERLARSPYCAGGFTWTGIDYLGEPIPYTDFARSSYFGNVDLTGVPKDRFWLFRSYWNPEATTIHILPHWNWPGKEGQRVPVFVYTNGDSAELFINGKSQGLRRKGECELPDGRTNECYRCCGKYRLMWFDTVYEPGEVKAVAYKDDVRLGEAVVRTAGQPVALRLTSEAPDIPADRETLAFVQVDAVDANGVRDPLATNRIEFALTGPGEIVAVGNGNPRDFKSFKDVSGHSLFFGKATVVIRRVGEGPIVLAARSEGLAQDVCRFPAGAFDLQAKIDRASCSGGGTVRVPRGDYPVAFLELKSNVRLELEEGARLYAETNALMSRARGFRHEHDQDMAMVIASGATNVAIVGRGVIDGLGQLATPYENNRPGRWKILDLRATKGILLEGVAISNSASWTCYFRRCEDVVCRSVRIDGHANYNNDGFDIEARNVLIEDCDIDCEDDCICGKIHDPDFVSENVVVRNCRLASNCNFVKIGTASHGIFRDWHVHDIVMERCRVAPFDGLNWKKRGIPGVDDDVSGLAGIALEVVDGGAIEDVLVERIEMRSGVQTPIFCRVGARADGNARDWHFRNVTIRDVRGSSCSWIASSLTGVPSRRLGGGILLKDIDLTVKGGLFGDAWRKPVPEREKDYPENRMFGTPLPACGFYLRHADGVRFENVNVRVDGTDPRPEVVREDCR